MAMVMATTIDDVDDDDDNSSGIEDAHDLSQHDFN